MILAVDIQYADKRELPCILALLQDITVEPLIVVVDGYVTLGKHHKPGLGMHLYVPRNYRTRLV